MTSPLKPSGADGESASPATATRNRYATDAAEKFAAIFPTQSYLTVDFISDILEGRPESDYKEVLRCFESGFRTELKFEESHKEKCAARANGLYASSPDSSAGSSRGVGQAKVAGAESSARVLEFGQGVNPTPPPAAPQPSSPFPQLTSPPAEPRNDTEGRLFSACSYIDSPSTARNFSFLLSS